MIAILNYVHKGVKALSIFFPAFFQLQHIECGRTMLSAYSNFSVLWPNFIILAIPKTISAWFYFLSFSLSGGTKLDQCTIDFDFRCLELDQCHIIKLKTPCLQGTQSNFLFLYSD